MKKTLKELLDPKVLIVIALGVLIRLIFIKSLGFVFDSETQYTWGKTALDWGFVSFWRDYDQYLDYQPGAIYLGMLINFFAGMFGGSLQAYVVVAKILNLLVDTALFISVFYVLRNRLNLEFKKALIPSLLLFFSPGLWIISAFWGQFDNLLLLLTLWSYVLMTVKSERKLIKLPYILWAGFIYAFAISLKLQPFIFIPLIAIFLVTQRKFKDILNYSLGFVAAFVGMNILPFIVNFRRTFDMFMVIFNRGEDISKGANTFWTLFPSLQKSTDVLFHVGSKGIEVSHIGILLFASVLILSTILFLGPNLKARSVNELWTSVKGRLNLQILIAWSVIVNCGYFMFMMNMHSRYGQFAVVYNFIVLAFIPSLKNKIIYATAAIIFSVVYTINQLGVHYAWYSESWGIEGLEVILWRGREMALMSIVVFCIVFFLIYKNILKLRNTDYKNN